MSNISISFSGQRSAVFLGIMESIPLRQVEGEYPIISGICASLEITEAANDSLSMHLICATCMPRKVIFSSFIFFQLSMYSSVAHVMS